MKKVYTIGLTFDQVNVLIQICRDGYLKTDDRLNPYGKLLNPAFNNILVNEDKTFTVFSKPDMLLKEDLLNGYLGNAELLDFKKLVAFIVPADKIGNYIFNSSNKDVPPNISAKGEWASIFYQIGFNFAMQEKEKNELFFMIQSLTKYFNPPTLKE